MVYHCLDDNRRCSCRLSRELVIYCRSTPDLRGFVKGLSKESHRRAGRPEIIRGIGFANEGVSGRDSKDRKMFAMSPPLAEIASPRAVREPHRASRKLSRPFAQRGLAIRIGRRPGTIAIIDHEQGIPHLNSGCFQAYRRHQRTQTQGECRGCSASPYRRNVRTQRRQSR